MDYSIVKVDKNNYTLFDNMVFFRINGRDKNEIERISNKIDNRFFFKGFRRRKTQAVVSRLLG